MFANDLEDVGSIPGRVIPKTQIMVLDATLLNTQHYKVRVKWRNPGKGVVPFPTPCCRSYQKGSLLDALDYGHQLTYDRQPYLLIISFWLICLVGRVFANGPEDLGSIPGRVIPKTLKMVLDTSLLNTQHYKVCIKGKVDQLRERSSSLPYTSV